MAAPDSHAPDLTADARLQVWHWKGQGEVPKRQLSSLCEPACAHADLCGQQGLGSHIAPQHVCGTLALLRSLQHSPCQSTCTHPCHDPTFIYSILPHVCTPTSAA